MSRGDVLVRMQSKRISMLHLVSDQRTFRAWVFRKARGGGRYERVLLLRSPGLFTFADIRLLKGQRLGENRDVMTAVIVTTARISIHSVNTE